MTRYFMTCDEAYNWASMMTETKFDNYEIRITDMGIRVDVF